PQCGRPHNFKLYGMGRNLSTKKELLVNFHFCFRVVNKRKMRQQSWRHFKPFKYFQMNESRVVFHRKHLVK
ncbi:MAG: hypothetical protein VZQ47_12560, partial [Treponema sp.]|nr:hypothetical protein [Treponema sp.]MEE3436376.1 hypothetical protein [Treponema sp.]